MKFYKHTMDPNPVINYPDTATGVEWRGFEGRYARVCEGAAAPNRARLLYTHGGALSWKILMLLGEKSVRWAEKERGI